MSLPTGSRGFILSADGATVGVSSSAVSVASVSSSLVKGSACTSSGGVSIFLSLGAGIGVCGVCSTWGGSLGSF